MPGVTYRVQSTSQLNGGTWNNLGRTIPATSTNTTVNNAAIPNATLFSRVLKP